MIDTVRRIDRDRRKHVAVLSKRIGEVISQSVASAASAIRLGYDPVLAARREIVGDDVTGIRGLRPAIATSMMLANLQGQRRTVLESRQASKRIELSRRKEKEEQQRHLELLALLAWLGLDDKAAEGYRLRFAASARPITEKIAGVVTDRVAESAKRLAASPTRVAFTEYSESPFTPPARSNVPIENRSVAFKTDLQAELDKIGFRQTGLGYSGWANAAVSTAFEGGRLDDAIALPGVSEMLWGYHYSAILDGKTSEMCRNLDGMVVEQNDPRVKQWRPPNHFHCRSLWVPVWQSSELKRPEPKIPSLPQATWDRYVDIKERFLRYL